MQAEHHAEWLEVFVQLESDNSCRSEATFDEEDEGMLSAEDVFLA